MKKYKLTDETIKVEGHTLHRIKARRNFAAVRCGDLGGFIEREDNLSHDGECWVGGNAMVFVEARVRDNARVYGNAMVYGSAMVYGNAMVCGSARVYCNAEVYGSTYVCDDARVSGSAWVFGDAIVCDGAQVYGSARVGGYARVSGSAQIVGNAKVAGITDYIVFKNWWSSGRYFTWTRSNNMWSSGCFHGTGDELIKKAYNDSELSGREYERLVKYVNEILNNGK